MRQAATIPVVLSLGILACGDVRSTAELPAQLEARVASEGVVRRAADLTFRYTEAPGRRGPAGKTAEPRRSEELWSFVPPDGDAAGWTRDLRAVMRQTTRPTGAA